MAFVDHAGARIHWRSLGKGEPLVLIMGLGCSSAMWFRLAPKLARRHRVILIDNRGVGLTEARHFVVHRVATMAADVAAVLDAAGEASAHVAGLSMGGMIAQQFAIDFPDRVRNLILMATNCGGAHAVLAERHIWQLLFSKHDASPEDSLAAMRPYTYARATPDEVIEEDNLVRLANHPPLRGYHAQLYGLMGWSSYRSLPSLRCRSLLLHGVEDQLIPIANAHVLAARIPGAQLVELEGASHWVHTDQTARTAEAVLTFIGQRPPRSPAALPPHT